MPEYGDKCDKCNHVLFVGWSPITTFYENEEEVTVNTKIWYCPECQEFKGVEH